MNHVWLKSLLKNLDNQVDEATRQRVMEACGETCPFTHLPTDKLMALKSASDGEQEFLDQLRDNWRLIKDDERYFVIYDQCYCPMVNDDLDGVSQTLCYCTLGNIKRIFRNGLGREVGVTMEKTILAGDDECRFYIDLSMVNSGT